MVENHVQDRERFAYFVTFSCYKRRQLLNVDQAKRIVLGALNAQLRRLDGRCVGFVVMPNHVHATLWFAEPDQLSEALKQWKRMSSIRIKNLLRSRHKHYFEAFDAVDDPVWQARYYAFHIYSEHKLEEKLLYMHANPVRAGLVKRPEDWPWSSARWYRWKQSVGVPVGWLD